MGSFNRRSTIPLAAFLVVLNISAAAPASAAPLNRENLAFRFQPHLFFDTPERWRPIDVDAFLAEPGHKACPVRSGPGPCPALTTPAQLTPAVGHLDLRGSGSGDAAPPDVATCAKSEPTLLECDLNHRSAIYAHVQRIGRRIAIDYWWFLRYNAIRLGNHEGDWEGVTVILDASGRQIEEVHFAAHRDVWRYQADTLRYDGGHVHVYVAKGSHAAYPRPCRTTHICHQTNLLPETRFNGRRPWVANDSDVCARRCVRLLGQPGNRLAWNAWPGVWGVDDGPKSPAFQSRYKNPFAAKPSLRRLF